MEKLELFLWNSSNDYIKNKLYDFKTKDDFDVFLKDYIDNSEKDEFETTKEFYFRCRNEILNGVLGQQKISMKYNADEEYFNISISEFLNFKINISREFARDFKEMVEEFDIYFNQNFELQEISVEFMGQIYLGTDFNKNCCDFQTIKQAISRIQLIEITGKSWETLKNLTSLNLERNRLERLPETIGELKNLSSLDLSSNENLDFDDAFKKLSTLKNLSSLNLWNNKLERLPESIGNLKNLSLLNLWNNKLERLPESINELKDLEFLHIDLNVKIDNLSEHIKKAISRSKLIEITGKSWETLKNLSSLDLRSNQLKRLPETIGELKNLSSLNLGGNEDLDFDDAFKKLSTLKNLSSLDLENNYLSRLPESIGELKNLSSLDLCWNGLERLPETIGELKNLSSLDLSENKLGRLPESIKKLASTLKELYLIGNPVWNNQEEMEKIESWLPNTKIKKW